MGDTSGGVRVVLGGGKFNAGFMSGSFAQFSSQATANIEGPGGYAVSSLGGGIGAKLAGGDFGEGAITETVGRALNDDLSHGATHKDMNGTAGYDESLLSSDFDGLTAQEQSLYGNNMHVHAGGQVAGHILIGGGSVSTNFYIGSDQNICAATTTCMRIGPGIMSQAGGTGGIGITRGGTENVQGISVGIGGDIGIPGAMIGGSLTVGPASGGIATGHFRTGAGISVGLGNL